ncbi:hypothetical protein YC2023_032725 [Brassica napus]
MATIRTKFNHQLGNLMIQYRQRLFFFIMEKCEEEDQEAYDNFKRDRSVFEEVVSHRGDK